MTEQETTESRLFANGRRKSSANTYTWAERNEDASVGDGLSDAQQCADESHCPCESVDDREVFEAVLQSLGGRARHALAYGHVKSLPEFMHLEPDAMAGWPNTGAKTIAEIVDAQVRIAKLAEDGRVYCKDTWDGERGSRSCAEALEQYIEDANGEVTYDTLRDYAIDDLCLKEFQFQQCICQLSNVVRTDDGGFLYLESASDTRQPEPAENDISSSSKTALKPAYAKMITDLVSAHFPNGFRIDSPIEVSRFHRFVAEDFGDKVSINDQELMKSIASCGTLSDGKVYIISNEIQSRIRDEVDLAISGGAQIIFYDSFYARHEEWLFGDSVFSEGILKDILIKLYPKYMHKLNYFTPTAESTTEIAGIRSDIMRVWGDDVTLNYNQISERLPYIPFDKVKLALATCSNFIRNTKEVYTHIDKVDVADEECAEIVDYVAAACREHGYASLSDVPLGEIGARNYELTLMAVHNAVFEIALADNYDRRGKIVTRKGNKLDALTIMKEYCSTLDRCSLRSLLDFERELTGESHRWIPMEAGYSIMVRVDRDDYVAEKYVHFDAAGIDDILDLFVTGEYLPLKSITTFAAFPYCGQAWNLYLLESFCRRFSDRYRFDVLAVNSRNVGAIIRKSCHLSYLQIMADAAAKSDTPLENGAILGFLLSSGYLGKRAYAKIDELIEQAKVLREARG